MALVGLRIQGRQYEVACDDGQENHLRTLADEVDDRVRALVKAMGGSVTTDMAMLLAALTMADELLENKKENQEIAAEVQRLASLTNDDRHMGQGERMADIEQAMATTLEEIALRIEKIADQVEIR